MKPLPVEPLTPDAFAPFGKLLRRDESNPEAFQALFTDSDAQGWRVASLDPPSGPPVRIHRHPDSHECFAPLFGETHFIVAPAKDRENVRCFALTEPICVFSQVWHEMFALHGHARLFIAENATVAGEAHFFGQPLAIG